MSGVVIRCQNCGTTQAELGECEACHEGIARYFCPNHAPALWLDGPSCSACGARVGAPPTSARDAAPTASWRARRMAPPPPSPARTHIPARHVEPTRRPEAEIIDILRRSAAGVRRPAERTDVDVPAHADEPTHAGEPTGAALFFGCLRRLVIVGVVLFLLALLAFYLLFRVGGPLNGALQPTDAVPLATSQLTSPAESHSIGHASLAEELSRAASSPRLRTPLV